MAKTIDAAPLNPTQEMNNFSFIEYLNGYNAVSYTHLIPSFFATST